MDSIHDLYLPLVHRRPGLIIYWVSVIVVVSIVLMNLVTAVLVENAISSARMDDEMEAYYTRKILRRLTPEIKQVFKQLDSSGNDAVSIRELVDAIEEGIDIPDELKDIIQPDKLVDLFEYLDLDGSGELSEAE